MSEKRLVEMTGSELVATYNELAEFLGERTLKKFVSKTVGIKRIKVLQDRKASLNVMDEVQLLITAAEGAQKVLDDGRVARVMIKWEVPEGNTPPAIEYAISSFQILKEARKMWAQGHSEGNRPLKIEVGEYQTQKEEEPEKPKRQRSAATPKNNTKVAKFTRADALATVLKWSKPLTKAQIVEETNALYVKNGGKDNVKEATWTFNTSMALLKALGTVKIDGDQYKLV